MNSSYTLEERRLTTTTIEERMLAMGKAGSSKRGKIQEPALRGAKEEKGGTLLNLPFSENPSGRR